MAAALTGVLLAVLAAAWWRRLKPSNDRDWRPEVARLASAEFQGDRVTVKNVRNFRYRAVEDFDERWEERGYDLSRLESLDVFFIDWGAPLINHTILSWSFAGGRRLAISVEVRKRRGQKYSAWKALLRNYELIYVAADEADVIKLRTNYRHEQVYLYRVRTSQAAARNLLVDFLQAMNAIAREPLWYNALTANCTSVIRERVLHAGGRLPLTWRLLANAYLPEYLHRRGIIDNRLPFAELKALAHINARALAAGDADFSAKIREGLPAPGLG
jgi:CRISPR/Cas system-associated exonuclease Cas4 (RecB family)